MAVMAAPYFVFSGSWGIKPDGTILVSPKLDDWMNADIGQRSVSTLFGMTSTIIATRAIRRPSA